MSRHSKLIILLICSSLAVACNKDAEPMVEATIIGSTLNPDPILQEVEKLQQNGTVTNVTVMESFPVQIRLTASSKTIHQLKAKSVALAGKKE